MADSTKDPVKQSVLVLGPWVIGAFLDVLLQGILFAQFYTYFSLYRDDKPALRIYVAVLAVLTTLKACVSFATVWIQNVVFFSRLDDALLLQYTTWWQAGTPLIGAALCLYVEFYFCYRLYAISKMAWVVVPVLIIFVFAFVAICVATYFIFTLVFDKIGMWFAAHLSSAFAGDLLLTLLTAFFLLKTKKEVLPQTVGIITSLVRLTFSTAAPAMICAMLNLVFSQVFQGTDNIISTTFNMMLPKLYAISMMYILNARRNIRTAMHSTGVTSSSHDIRSRPRNRSNADEMEMGNFSVNVRTETQRHIDMSNMFASDGSERDRKIAPIPSQESYFKAGV